MIRALLHIHTRPRNMAALAKSLQVSRPMVTLLVGQMASEGFVEKYQANGAKEKRPILTAKGAELIQMLLGVHGHVSVIEEMSALARESLDTLALHAGRCTNVQIAFLTALTFKGTKNIPVMKLGRFLPSSSLTSITITKLENQGLLKRHGLISSIGLKSEWKKAVTFTIKGKRALCYREGHG